MGGGGGVEQLIALVDILVTRMLSFLVFSRQCLANSIIITNTRSLRCVSEVIISIFGIKLISY